MLVQMLEFAKLSWTVSWALIFFGVMASTAWPRTLAMFVTGMYLFDYLIGIRLNVNAEDKFFKHWGGVAAILLIVYCIWL